MVSLYSADDWKKRNCNLVRGEPARVVFVVGAGLSWDGSVGVWGVAEILRHVKDTYGIEGSATLTSAAYQEVLGRLKANHGPKAVEQTIRRAVLAAARDGDGKARALKEVESGSGVDACKALQNDSAAWNLPTGVQALADLIATIESQSARGWPHPCVLSTNFDGLLEVALRQRKTDFRSEAVAGDQFPHDIDQQVSILHLHGYWPTRQPTLHESAALRAKRQSLEAALRLLLQGAHVSVMGYAGWNDIIFGTASTVLERQESDHLPEVMWAFHESEKKVRDEEPNGNLACGHVLTSFANSIARAQTTFYCGVNLHRDLPEVVKDLAIPGAPVGSSSATTAASLALVPYIEDLLPVVPKAFLSDFQALLDDARQSKPVGLVGVVALCCMVLEDAPKDLDLRTRFGEPAWDLIAFMVAGLVGPLRHQVSEIATKPGEVIRVPAKTHFMVALLVARKTHARDLLLPGPKGAISRDDLSLATRSMPFEVGPAEPDRMFQFEALVWKAIFPSEPGYALGCKENTCVRATCKNECSRRDLYDRLGADSEKGHPHFLMINPASGAAWKDIAAKAKEIVFVEPDGSATAGIDEGRLAFLISDFLKLTSKENS